jgi:hypothetical protein
MATSTDAFDHLSMMGLDALLDMGSASSGVRLSLRHRVTSTRSTPQRGCVRQDPHGSETAGEDPPLISFSVMVTSSTYPRIRETGKFSVNVLSKAQQPISNQFARRGIDKWAGFAWKMSDGQNPIIDGTLTSLDCEIVAEHQAGDHYIVIGQVLTIGSNDRHIDEPLVYFKGNYRHLNDSGDSTA